MSKTHEIDWSDLDDIPPIVPEPGNNKDKLSYSTNGYKYYLKIKQQLQEWWDEFNSDTDKSGKPKYKNIRNFISTRTKNKEERHFLYLMIGPRPLDEENTNSGKNIVPWLGDWYLRRKNGYWLEDNKLQVKQLSKAIKDNLNSSETVKASAPFLIQELMRINRLMGKLDELFGGNPFLMDENPSSKGNLIRFGTYTKMFNELFKAKKLIIHEVMRVMGINPHDPGQMHNMAQLAAVSGQIGASAALTGAMAGSYQLPGNTGPGIVISRDALLIGDFLTKHGATFKKELPELILEGDEVKEVVAKSNGKHKTQ